ncbi:MAG: hypothetical protein IJT21_01570 [Synergistaceae bacterium]|nr:hypothetical protein [Synergistaceae bacterium]
MANEITRDGVTYKVLRTFEYDENGELQSREGGEITDELIDSLIEQDRIDAELEAEERELEQAEYEATHLTPEEQRAFKHAKSFKL